MIDMKTCCRTCDRTRRLLVSALGLVMAFSPVAAKEARAPSRLPVGSTYVALGSSYAAGAGIGPTAAGSPARCRQAVNNYPRVVATQLRLTLVDASCSGATTAHLLRAWDELPAQLDSLTADTRLVTVTIGGNDVHLVGDLALSECRGDDGAPRVGCTLPAAPTASQWAGLKRNLLDVAREVRRRSPAARLIFIDYLDMLPRGQTCAAVPFDRAGLAHARDTFRRLAALTAQVARTARATLIPAGRMSRGHDGCSASPYAVGRSSSGAPWHPTAAGHAAIARALVRALER